MSDDPSTMGMSSGLTPMDELRLCDMACRAHEHDMKQATGPDPIQGLSDPIDGMPREHPGDMVEPAVELPDIL